MIASLRVGNPENTMAYICDCMLTQMKAGVRPENVHWSRDEDTAINAMCKKCHVAMNEDRFNDVNLALVAEGKIIRIIEEDMKGQAS